MLPNRFLLRGAWLTLLLACVYLAGMGGPASADTAKTAPAKASPPAASAPMPDYGGRDDPGALSSAGTDAPDPAAQVGRSLFALIVVLGGVVGVVVLLKRAGYAGGPVGAALASGLRQSAAPKPAAQSGPLALLQSQALPGGGAVHLLSLHDKTLVLVGATAQSVALLAEWEQESDAPEERSEEPLTPPRNLFAERLARLDAAAAEPPPPAPSLSLHNAAVSDVLAHGRPRGSQEKPE